MFCNFVPRQEFCNPLVQTESSALAKRRVAHGAEGTKACPFHDVTSRDNDCADMLPADFTFIDVENVHVIELLHF